MTFTNYCLAMYEMFGGWKGLVSSGLASIGLMGAMPVTYTKRKLKPLPFRNHNLPVERRLKKKMENNTGNVVSVIAMIVAILALGFTFYTSQNIPTNAVDLSGVNSQIANLRTDSTAIASSLSVLANKQSADYATLNNKIISQPSANLKTLEADVSDLEDAVKDCILDSLTSRTFITSVDFATNTTETRDLWVFDKESNDVEECLNDLY